MVCSFDGTVAYLSFSEKELGVTFDRPKLFAALERLYGSNCPTLAQLTCLGLRHALPLPSPLRPPPPKAEPRVPALTSKDSAPSTLCSSTPHVPLPNGVARDPTTAVGSTIATGDSTATSTATASLPSQMVATASSVAPIPAPSVQHEVRLPSGKRRIIPKFVAPLDDSAGTTPFQSSAAPSSEVLPLSALCAAGANAPSGGSSGLSAFTSSAASVQSASTSNLLVSSTSAAAVPPKPPGALATTSAAPADATSTSTLVPFSRQASSKPRRLRVEDDELDAPLSSVASMPPPVSNAPPLSPLLPFENQLPPPPLPQPDPFSFLPGDFTSTPLLASQPAYLLLGILYIYIKVS